MDKVLIVHASRHGSTAGIAVRIGEVLRGEGIDAVVTSAAEGRDPSGFGACIVGGGVYMGSWVKEGVEFLEHHQLALSRIPVWLFSSGPLPGSTRETPPGTDPVTNALGPVEGPGSGGRKRIDAVAGAIHVREHHVFQGAFDPSDPPKAMSERLVRLMPAAKDILPPGDFRQWDLIEAWAREIAADLKATAAKEPAPVG